jgi:hypothetical protein
VLTATVAKKFTPPSGEREKVLGRFLPVAGAVMNRNGGEFSGS